MAPAAALLFSRRLENCTFTEDGYIDESSCDVPFWSSRVGAAPCCLLKTRWLTPWQTGAIVKWSLFLGIIVIFGLYLLIGYVHAQKRIQKGLPPLGYHRVCLAWSSSQTQNANVCPVPCLPLGTGPSRPAVPASPAGKHLPVPP
jgi:hypothetical protein